MLGLGALALAVPRLVEGTAAILREPGPGSRTDFAWMYFAMRVAWLGLTRAPGARHLLYDQAAATSWMRRHHVPYSPLDLYGYPPTFALAFAPLGALPYEVAQDVWTVLGFLSFLAAIALAADLALPRSPWGVRALVAALGLACFPALTTLYWGQTDTVVLLLLAAGLWCVARGRAATGGALLMAGALLKLTPAVAVAFYAVRWGWAALRGAPGRGRDAAVVRGALAIGVLGTGAAIAALGWTPCAVYVRSVLPDVQRVALAVGSAPMEQSVRGVLLLFLAPGPLLRGLVDAAAVAAPAALLACDRRRPPGDERGLHAGVALLPLLSAPSLEGHHFVVAALPEVVVGGWLLDGRTGWRPWARRAAWTAYGLAAIGLTVPGYPFLPALGRPLCAAPGQPGWLPAALLTACEGQHLWSVLLLFGLALSAVAARRPTERQASLGFARGRSARRPVPQRA
jgi:hypothetical protein